MSSRDPDMSEQKNYSPWIEDDCYQFITPGRAPVKRIIVTAANRNRKTGVIVVGSRHGSPAMRMQIEAIGGDHSDFWFDQGFIDQYDQYLSREDAKRIALKNGQPLIGEDWGNELFSENLH